MKFQIKAKASGKINGQVQEIIRINRIISLYWSEFRKQRAHSN